jgi:hypothetical protein
MEQEPVNEHAVREDLPTETERNYGMLTAGGLALIVIGTTIYLVS